MLVSSWFGGLGNRGVRLVSGSDAVLDVSGGDSFTDLYGANRFRMMTFPKELALRLHRPLILLPQTYGPFRDPDHRRRARSILETAAQAWARDPDSYDVVRDLLGDALDPERHRLGVDLAFSLPARRPEVLPEWLESWLDDRSTPVVGVNVSGLLYHESARERFGLRVDYPLLATRLVKSLLAGGSARVLLISHVHRSPGTIDADPDACQAVQTSVRASAGNLQVLPPRYDAAETKWIISRLDWFCGPRMHATIAALSSGVPAVNIAYSDKARGVFATAGQIESVVDARHASTEEAVERILSDFAQRDVRRSSLARSLPSVFDAAEAQFDAIVGAVASARR